MSYRVIAVDDQPDNLLILEDFLGREVAVTTFAHGQQLIDYVAAGVAISIVGSVLSNISSGLGGTVNFVLSIGWMLYLGYLSGTTGITPGRALTKTKLIGEATGAPVGVV